jgi:chemotaxis protein MotB
MARRKFTEEHENHERWLVSYADFVTLLFAFFTVMYATSKVDAEKVDQFEKSIKHYMAVVGFSRYNEIDDGKKLDESTFVDANVFPKVGHGVKEIQDYVDRALDRALGKEERQRVVSGLRHDSVGVRISLAASALFKLGSARLNDEALEGLNRIASLLKESRRQIIIEGHTDDLFISTSAFPSNWELAAFRATTLVRYFIKVHQFDPRRLVAISYGSEKPVVANDSEAHREQNRRVEILIVTDQ